MTYNVLSGTLSPTQSISGISANQCKTCPILLQYGLGHKFSVLVKRLARKSISEMTYFVSSVMYNLKQ